MSPFLRNRSRASARRSWRAATSHRRSAALVSPLRTEQASRPFQQLASPLRDLVRVDVELLSQLGQCLSPLMAASATFALKAGVWFRRGRLLIVSPDSRRTVPAVRQKLHSTVRADFRSQLSNLWC